MNDLVPPTGYDAVQTPVYRWTMGHISTSMLAHRRPPKELRRRDTGNGQNVDWSRWLRPGEHLVWAGQPEADAVPMIYPIREPQARWAIAAFVVGLLAIFLYVLLPGIGADPLTLFLVMLPVAALLFGLWYLLFGQPYWRRYWLGRTRYALTDQRAIIARRALWRYWTISIPIAKMTPASLVNLGRIGHVMFRQFETNMSYSPISQGMVLSSRHYSAGFLFLGDAGYLHRKLVQLQSASAARG